MESIQKFLNRRKSSSKFSLFCRKSRHTPSVIELPIKDGKDANDCVVMVSRPAPDVRLVLFRECGETSDRKLLFDSKSFEPEKTDRYETRNYQTQGLINNNKPQNGCKMNSHYQYVRGPQDSGILSEMLFGSVGMASRASSLKVHIIKEPPQLMLSRVFCVESTKDATVSLDRGMEFHVQSSRQSSVSSRRKAKTLPVPTPEAPHIPPPSLASVASSLTSRLTRSDSSSSLMSLSSLFGNSLSHSGSLGSKSTSNSVPLNMRAHSLPHRQLSRDSFTLNQEPLHGVTSRKTKVKIGFAVIFQPEPSNSSEFQRFFFEHFPLIESYVTFLKEQVENALNTCRRTRDYEFIEAMMEAIYILSQRISAIYSTPRLPKPVWSSLTTATSQKSPWFGDKVTVECFIADLTRMATEHNTKSKNYFMSGLITAVLTHHLGWVNTIMPAQSDNEGPVLAYNPLWAQLGDLYGAVGSPTKVAKTVVVGEIHELVSTIISILSYFIRCSQIKEVVKVPDAITPQNFLDEENLEMSSIPCDLESDYVFVSHTGDDEQSAMTKSMDHDSTFCRKSDSNSTMHKSASENSKRLSFCSKFKKTKEVLNPPKVDLSSSPGSTLCRSRSSPATSTKPQLKFSRQKSSGNMEIVPQMRLRTNSNDALTRPRGVQSRRTSHDVTNARRMSQSSSALVIPDSENFTLPSIEGSKSLCMDNTPIFDLKKRLGGGDSGGSCPSDGLNQGPANFAKPPFAKRKLTQTPSHPPQTPSPGARVRTHKRVSSEPFTITKLPNGEGDLVKTKSIYFDSQNVVRQTFVERIEPKIVNVALVQRANPVIAIKSPISSPHLPRSVGVKGPIVGFKTSDDIPTLKPRKKHASGSYIPDNSPISCEFREIFSPESPELEYSLNSERMNENEDNKEGIRQKARRSSSNVSCGGVRRSSSSNSGKIRIAGRRRKLTAESQEHEELHEGKELPPLNRIPSISLKHDDFDEYFEETENVTFVSTETSTSSQNQPSVTENEPSIVQNQTSVTETVQKADNQSCMAKKGPPPLPTVGPVHKSKTTLHMDVNMNKAPSKPPPPLPKSRPVHRGPLYPKLDSNLPSLPQSTVKSAELPKTSLYPSLDGCEKSPYNENCDGVKVERLYPQLDAEMTSNSNSSNLYPNLPNSFSSGVTFENDKNSAKNYSKTADILGENNQNVELKNDEEENFFTCGESIPLKSLNFTENETMERQMQDDEESRLTFSELLADYSPDYLWGFALHGTRNQTGLYSNVIHELQHSVIRPVLDEPVSEAVSIVADLDKWTVQVLSSHRIHSERTALPALTSKLVTNILDRITRLYTMKTPAAFCMEELENELGELVLKSRMLARYVVGNTRVTMSQLSAVLGIESSDLPLLMAIASCHNPQVAATLL